MDRIMLPIRLLFLLSTLPALSHIEPSSATHSLAALEGETIVFVGARVLPIATDPIEDGIMIVRDGRILAVGTKDDVSIPAGAEVRDVSGMILMPGLVDTHSHIGGGSGADNSAPIQPEVRIVDSIDVRSASIQRAQAGGITTVNVMPGSGHLMSGQTVYLKLRDAGTIEELALRRADGAFAGGMKMANGTNSRGDAPFPGTRAKSAALVRQQYINAQAYAAKQAAADDGEGEAPDRDLGMEALVEVLDGTRIVHHHTHRHDDVLTVLRLAEEFGFRVVLHHVSEAWKVADEIAAAGVPCSIIVLDSPGGKLEAIDLKMENGAVLESAGASVAFHTDDWITDSRLFLRSAALSVRAGMSRTGALAGLTIEGAKMMGLEDRVGSLEVGKDADFILLDGDPLSVYTHVQETWIDGERVFDRSDPGDRLWAVGGPGAGEDSHPLCCGGRNQ
ncbi:MAG: imidazolonepropionase-like amidohydrolase [Gammaproteobacteria bacterium]